MSYVMHKTELGALKSKLEWSIAAPGRAWIVEGYEIYRVGGRYKINRVGEFDETLATPSHPG